MIKNYFLEHKSKTFCLSGLGLIGMGYICLSTPPANGFLSLTLAPVLLVLGYGVFIPLGLLYFNKKRSD